MDAVLSHRWLNVCLMMALLRQCMVWLLLLLSL